MWHIPHNGGQQHPQPAQHQPGSHSGQHSQPPTALHHATGTVQQQRSPHPHPMIHHQPHHQHTQHQQSQQIPIQSIQHSIPHQIVVNHAQYPSSNMVYQPTGPYHSGHVPSAYNSSAISHRPDVAANLNSQQTTSINPNNMSQISHIAPPVISTVATNTTNVHHQSSNSPVIDPNMHPRMNQIYMQTPGFTYNLMMPTYAMPQPYGGMQHGSMIPPRLASDLITNNPFNHQNHGNMAAKVPSNQASTVGPKPVTQAQKRERKPAIISDPSTGQPIDIEELKNSGKPSSKQESTTTIESHPPIAEESIGTDESKNSGKVSSIQESTTTTESQVSSTQEAINIDVPASTDEPSSKESTTAAELLLPSAVAAMSITDSGGPDNQDSKPAIESQVPPTREPLDIEESANSKQPLGNQEPATAIESQVPSTREQIDSEELKNVCKLSDNRESTTPIELEVTKTSEATIDPTISAQTDKHDSAQKRLNLPYFAGQYSPNNPGGKRKYSREFLMTVQELMKSELDCLSLSSNAPRVDIMAPTYMNHICYLAPNSRRSSQQAAARPKKVIATSSLQPEIELKTSENAWKPELEQEKSKAVEGGEMDTTRLLKVFRGHLNKLTPQKYDSIIEKVADLDLGGSDRLTSVIDLVFDKAVDEPGFCELYAKMCKVIASKHKEFFFHLVKKCQDEFETSDLYCGLNIESRKDEIEKEHDVLKKKMMSEELYEDMRLRRKKYLGTIKLIGEMYKFGLLIPKIIGLCMKHLIDGVSNENLECLCSLLATVGAKMANEEEVIIRESLNATLKVLHDFAHSKKVDDHFTLESRIKFKILDTIDLSRKHWRPRMVENMPKKIEEIREEAKEDKYKQLQRDQSSQSRNTMKNDDRHRRPGISTSYSKNQTSNKWP